VVIARDLKNALELVPEGVVLTPQKYHELLARIEQLEKLSRPARSITPTSCKLTGSVEGDVVRLQAQFDFRTEQPRAVVALGCQKAWPRPGALLDGKLPILFWVDNGLAVQVENAGVHQLSLELEVSLLPRGPTGMEQGFELGLPRAAITTLEQFTFARAVPEARINGRAVATRGSDPQRCHLESIPLGPIDRLELVWKTPAAAPAGGPVLLEAVARLAVRIDETQVTTEADFNLTVIGGAARQWRLQLPAGVSPQVRAQDERIASIDLPATGQSVMTIKLKEPSAEPLRVVFLVHQGAGPGLIPIGPYQVLDTVRQRGTISISAASNLRLHYHPQQDVVQREVSEDSKRDYSAAEFTYWGLPAAQGDKAPPPPLQIEVERIKGAVETRLEQNLVLADGHWRVSTRINLTPVHARVDHLEVLVPANYQYDREQGMSPAEIVESVEIKKASPKEQVLHIRLREQSQAFTLMLPGIYPMASRVMQSVLELPRPLEALDRGTQINVTVGEGLEIASVGPGVDVVPGERQLGWRREPSTPRLEIGWRPYRPNIPADSVVDVTLSETQGQVRHHLRLTFPQAPPSQLFLQIPPALSGRVRVLKGGTLGAGEMVTLDNPAAKEQVLLLAYSFAVTANRNPPRPKTGPKESPDAATTLGAHAIPIPIVFVEAATRTETKVRFWTDPGSVPSLFHGPWEELPTEIVPEQSSLPSLVLRSSALEAPLVVRAVERAAEPLASLIIDQALIQAAVSEGNYLTYRARFLVSHFNTRTLGIELPGPISRLAPEVFLDGKKLLRLQTSAGTDRQGARTTLAQAAIEPELYSKPVILEIRYFMAPGPARWPGSWQTVLQPPQFAGAEIFGRVQWQVQLPAGWVALVDGATIGGGWRWELQGGLLVPRPVATNPDSQFLEGGAASINSDAPLLGPKDIGVICWQSRLEPFMVINLPVQGWLLGWSFLLVMVCVALLFSGLPRRRFWTVIGLAGLGVATFGLRWPAVLPLIIYGCEPGLVVVALIALAYWVMQNRYRRRVVFLPSFARLQPNSSHIKKEGGSRPPLEPSTVDVPPKRESSVK
jgi:hypothetical protein